MAFVVVDVVAESFAVVDKSRIAGRLLVVASAVVIGDHNKAVGSLKHLHRVQFQVVASLKEAAPFLEDTPVVEAHSSLVAGALHDWHQNRVTTSLQDWMNRFPTHPWREKVPELC